MAAYESQLDSYLLAGAQALASMHEDVDVDVPPVVLAYVLITHSARVPRTVLVFGTLVQLCPELLVVSVDRPTLVQDGESQGMRASAEPMWYYSASTRVDPEVVLPAWAYWVLLSDLAHVQQKAISVRRCLESVPTPPIVS